MKDLPQEIIHEVSETKVSQGLNVWSGCSDYVLQLHIWQF